MSRFNNIFPDRPGDSRPLEVRVQEAIAWGVPDNESLGFSQAALTKLLSELLRAYKDLQKKVQTDKEFGQPHHGHDRS